MEWAQDALRVYFCHQKNDQSGEKKRDPRHIYANPLDPTVCPILALSLYLLSIHVNIEDTCLFPGGCQYSRFQKYLSKILILHKEEILTEFGIKNDDIGVHSIRKGAGTYISSGCYHAPGGMEFTGRTGYVPSL